MTIIPAYGRDYKSQAAVKQAWKDGKDFKIMSIGPDDGRYINIQDATSLAHELMQPRLNIMARYNQLMYSVKVS